MSNNKAKKQSYQAVLATVKKEMAEPCAAESAQMPMTNAAKACPSAINITWVNLGWTAAMSHDG